LQEIDRAADTMRQIVQDLLLLAHADAGQAGRERIELLVREVLERAIAQTARKDSAPVRLHISDETLAVPANEGELARLFSNLLDNARRATPPEGQITVTAAREADQIVMRVADTGIGIAPQHLPHLAERFYRIDTARARLDGGTGLGLSICKSIVDAHGGTLSFQSTPGKGTTVTVSLPAN
jgi:signal transduction histidine kinase